MDRMRPAAILHCPLRSVEEVVALVEAGADAFYAGLVPDMGRGTLASFLNRRNLRADNFTDFAEFELALDRAHAVGRPVYLTVNELVYPDELLSLLWRTLDRVAQLPALEGVILGDISLVAELRARYPGLRAVASSLAGVTNPGVVSVLRNLGVSRFVLPRTMRLDEIEDMITSCPDAEFECFVLNDRCPYEEHLCSFMHAYSGGGGADCQRLQGAGYRSHRRGWRCRGGQARGDCVWVSRRLRLQ